MMYYRDNRMSGTSGHGGCSCGTGAGINEIAALAAGAVGAFLLYQAITMAAAGRRKRSTSSFVDRAKDVILAGEVQWFLPSVRG
jgi:hypothetical protein